MAPSIAPFARGQVVWFRGRRGRLAGYHDDRRVRVRFDGQDGESIVAVAKLGRDRRESAVLALVAR